PRPTRRGSCFLPPPLACHPAQAETHRRVLAMWHDDYGSRRFRGDDIDKSLAISAQLVTPPSFLYRRNEAHAAPLARSASPMTSVRFPKHGWYAAIWSKDLASAPIARTFLNEPVVLFRGAHAKAAALQDRSCPPAAPLSRGEDAGDPPPCGYH